MNITTFIAGILTTICVVGHFSIGIKSYLVPMLGAEFEKIPKATMQCVFHYVTVFLILSAAFLLVQGSGFLFSSVGQITTKFIGINFLLFAIIQIFYSYKNGIKNPLIRMFQWTLFLPIGVLSLI